MFVLRINLNIIDLRTVFKEIYEMISYIMEISK